MHSSIPVANYLLKKSGYRFTPLQLIKLVYLSHGWMLGMYQRPLISSDVEAWKYGPTIPELYYRVKHYGSNQVDEKLCGLKNQLDEYETSVVNQVFDMYGRFSGVELSVLTHGFGSPWHRIYNGRARVIPNDVIKSYFRKKYEEKV